MTKPKEKVTSISFTKEELRKVIDGLEYLKEKTKEQNERLRDPDTYVYYWHRQDEEEEIDELIQKLCHKSNLVFIGKERLQKMIDKEVKA
jgi:hypothetical protein